MPFPSSVKASQAPAFAGDFASANPRKTILAGNAQITAGTSLFAGRFAWLDASGTVANSAGFGLPAGLVGRFQNSLITTFLAESSMQLLAGTPVTLFNDVDMWVVNSGTAATAIGQKAYAAYATGLVRFGATGAPATAASVTGAITDGSGSVTASITDTTMNVTAVGSGSVIVGAVLSGTGITTGTKVVKQLTGTAGGIGTYQVSELQTATSTTVTVTIGLLTVTAVGSGTLAVGDILSGTNVATGTYISALGTGAGGTGTYYVNGDVAATSTTITATADIETKWYCASVGAVGELVKITSTPNG